jgi:hypothetical protein
MSPDKKADLLSVMVLAITVEARSQISDLPDSQALHKLRGLNEIQHSIANQLCAYLTPKGNIRPADVFWSLLEEIASQYQLEDSLLSATEWSFSRDTFRIEE